MSQAGIIAAIRRGLRRGPLLADQIAMLESRMAAHARHIIPARGQLDLPGRIALFTHYAEREFASVERVGTLADVPAAIAGYLARLNLPPALVVSPHPQLKRIPFAKTPLLSVREGVCGPEDLVSLTQAFAGIAETGTLMLPSGPERPTRNNLLPDTAIVLLEAPRIVGSYEDGFDLLLARPDADTAGKPASSARRARDAALMPRNVMLVTGPSRSADIEQTLELGAHGPRRLHVLILDGEG